MITVSTKEPTMTTPQFYGPMTTVDGKRAAWPILHTFYSEERSKQISIVAETPSNARMNLEACGWYHLTYCSSKDANDRFVYDFTA
jgi:hypothetical protein